MEKKIVIITDLDGSLLHPSTYSFEGAVPTLNIIKDKGIPLILSSSKTRAEVGLYRKRLGNSHPFVSENGGGIFIPVDYFPFHIEGETKEGYIIITLGSPYNEVRKVFSEIKVETGVKATGFGDMTIEEVAELTGITIEEAALAKEREFDEPFIIDGTEKDKEYFCKGIDEKGFYRTEGRFLHILGNHDKGRAARILIGYYKRLFGKVTTVGIGDSLNDVPLLREVDLPVLMPKGDGKYEPAADFTNLIRAGKPGSDGWNDAVAEILRRM